MKKCNMRTHISGKMGGTYSNCRNRAKYKVSITYKDKTNTIYLCGIHLNKCKRETPDPVKINYEEVKK